jgi:NAD(P)H dehydrogenase (quinone)
MKIGIIVYSLSGHTVAAATALREKLAAVGHTVTVERLEMVGPARSSAEKRAELQRRPAVDPYDALVFACPVRGGAPPPPMMSYLQGIPALQGKKVACLVTHGLLRAWGAKQALAAMKQVCAAKGATVCGEGSVWWFGPGRERRVAQAMDEVARCFER